MDWESKIVFESPRMRIGQFRCAAGSSLWQEDNQTEDLPIVVFPRTAVNIRQSHHRPVIANPNTVVFYDAFQPYQRRVIDPRGDRCEFFAVSPELLEEVLSATNSSTVKLSSRFFDQASAPCDSKNYISQRSLLSYVLTDPEPDRLFVEESLMSILNRVLAGAAQFQRRRPSNESPAHRRHLSCVDSAKEFISLNHQRPITLELIAENVGCSVYHLCRIFKAHVGYTIHQYLSQYRLRSSIERVIGFGNRQLTKVALDYCFASHSHFSNSFRKAFGLSPKQFRQTHPARLLTMINNS